MTLVGDQGPCSCGRLWVKFPIHPPALPPLHLLPLAVSAITQYIIARVRGAHVPLATEIEVSET